MDENSNKVVKLTQYKFSQQHNPSNGFGGGGGVGGGGEEVDTETQRYVDRSMEMVRAQNDARFSEVLSSIKDLKSDLDSKPIPPSLWQITGIAFAAIGFTFAILAFASDRFDGGVAASGLVEDAVKRISEAQIARDEAQDETLDDIARNVQMMRDELQAPAQRVPLEPQFRSQTPEPAPQD